MAASGHGRISPCSGCHRLCPINPRIQGIERPGRSERPGRFVVYSLVVMASVVRLLREPLQDGAQKIHQAAATACLVRCRLVSTSADLFLGVE